MTPIKKPNMLYRPKINKPKTSVNLGIPKKYTKQDTLAISKIMDYYNMDKHKASRTLDKFKSEDHVDSLDVVKRLDRSSRTADEDNLNDLGNLSEVFSKNKGQSEEINNLEKNLSEEQLENNAFEKEKLNQNELHNKPKIKSLSLEMYLIYLLLFIGLFYFLGKIFLLF